MVTHMKRWINRKIRDAKEYYVRPRLIALAYALTVFIGLLVLWLYIGSLTKERLSLEERAQVTNRVNTIGNSLTLVVNQRLAMVTSVHSFINAEIESDHGFNFKDLYEIEHVNNFVSGCRLNCILRIRNP